jgi:hypothetical protein
MEVSGVCCFTGGSLSVMRLISLSNSLRSSMISLHCLCGC